MQKKNLIRFAESLVLLPILTVSMPFGSTQNFPDNGINTYPPIVLSQKQNIEVPGLSISPILSGISFNQAKDPVLDPALDLRAQIFKAQAKKAESIDAYFSERDMPLEGMGMKMVEEARKHGLDWRLLPAIAVRESTGGKFKCKKVKNNPFGWGSCRIGFGSNEEAIEIVARNLGGNNPNTSRHYDNKTTLQILRAYNPPSIVRHYAEQVMKIMDTIGDADVALVTPATT